MCSASFIGSSQKLSEIRMGGELLGSTEVCLTFEGVSDKSLAGGEVVIINICIFFNHIKYNKNNIRKVIIIGFSVGLTPITNISTGIKFSNKTIRGCSFMWWR